MTSIRLPKLSLSNARLGILTGMTLALGIAAVPAVAHSATPGDDRLDTERLNAELEDFAEVEGLDDHAVIAEVRDGDETWIAATGPRSLDWTRTTRGRGTDSASAAPPSR